MVRKPTPKRPRNDEWKLTDTTESHDDKVFVIDIYIYIYIYIYIHAISYTPSGIRKEVILETRLISEKSSFSKRM
jgi:hypothetical protein